MLQINEYIVFFLFSIIIRNEKNETSFQFASLNYLFFNNNNHKIFFKIKYQTNIKNTSK